MNDLAKSFSRNPKKKARFKEESCCYQPEVVWPQTSIMLRSDDDCLGLVQIIDDIVWKLQVGLDKSGRSQSKPLSQADVLETICIYFVSEVRFPNTFWLNAD